MTKNKDDITFFFLCVHVVCKQFKSDSKHHFPPSFRTPTSRQTASNKKRPLSQNPTTPCLSSSTTVWAFPRSKCQARTPPTTTATLWPIKDAPISAATANKWTQLFCPICRTRWQVPSHATQNLCPTKPARSGSTDLGCPLLLASTPRKSWHRPATSISTRSGSMDRMPTWTCHRQRQCPKYPTNKVEIFDIIVNLPGFLIVYVLFV